MSKFNWNDHPVVSAAPAPAAAAGPMAAPAPAAPGKFSWDDHPVVDAGEGAPAEPAGQPGEAAVEGFGQGATMGYLPHLQAAAYKGAQAVADMFGIGPDAVDKALAAKGFQINQGDDSYTSLRDENIARQQQLARDNPKAYYGGMVGGAVAMAPALEAGVAEVAPEAATATRLRKAATMGAAAGAIANPGDKAGEVAPLQLEDRAKNAAIGAGTGVAVDLGARAAGAALSAGKVTGKVVGATKDTISSLLSPRVAADAPELEAIAQKNGIPGELVSAAHRYGPDSGITRLQRTIAEGSSGEPYLQAHNEGILKTSQALENRIASTFGVPHGTEADAGQAIKDAVDSHISNVFDNADITYANASKKLGPISLDESGMDALRSKAVGMKNEALRLLRTSASPTQKSQAQNLQEWSDLILSKVEKGGSYKELADIVQNVGRAAYEKTPVGQVPADVRKLRELYNVGSEALIQSIRNHSPAAADALVVNNAEISEMLGDKAKLGKILESARSPEQVYSSLVKNGGSDQIATLKKILPEDTYNQLRSKYLSSLVKYSDQDGNFVNFKGTINAIKKNEDRINYLFDPSELKDTADLLKFGDRFGSPVMSSSGTGASNALRNFKDKLVSSVMDENTLHLLKNRAEAAGQAPAIPVRRSLTSAPPLPGARSALSDAVSGFASRETALPAQLATMGRQPLGGSGAAPASSAGAQPLMGRDKWANDGLQKLQAHAGRDPASSGILTQQLMNDPRAKALLIDASDLKPGSKGMSRILERIKALAAPSQH